MSARVLFVAIALALSAGPAAAESGRWWRDPATQRDVDLSPAQVSAIERVYETSVAERRVLRARLDREDRALAHALAQGTLTDAAAERLVNRVEHVRARRNIARTSLLVRIYDMLTPEQRRKLPLLLARQ